MVEGGKTIPQAGRSWRYHHISIGFSDSHKDNENYGMVVAPTRRFWKVTEWSDEDKT